MENSVLEIKRGKENRIQKRNAEDQDQFRIVITREANDSLEEAVAKVNKGLEGSAVTRTDLAVYVFTHLSKLLSDADFKALRALHFDEKKVLGAILKSEEDLPEELRRALREHYGIGDLNKKRPARIAPTLSTEVPVDNPPAA
jgi:hypothetical protein